MSTLGVANPGGPFLSAFNAVYAFLPLVAIAYYFLAANCGTNYATRRPQSLQRIVHIASLWQVPAVFATYVFDAASLLFVTFPLKMEDVDASILYAFGSVVSWGLLMVYFNGREAARWYPLGGFSMIYLFTESCLLAFQQRRANMGPSLSAALIFAHAFRLSVIAFLVCITIGSQLIPTRCRSRDEETLPLLRDDGEQNNGNRPGGYNTLHGSTARHTERPGSQSAEAEDGSVDPIKFFLPYFWPRDELFLQLLYVGIGICLLLERALKVFIPLTLGAIVLVLSENPGSIPWKMISSFIALCILDSKAGFPGVRDYMWLPLDKYVYSRISTAAFGKVMDLSSDFHDSKDSDSVWDTITRGLSVRYAFRTALFQLIPTIADCMLATIVLFAMFGGYMGLIVLLALACTSWSVTWIAPKQHSRGWRLKYGMDEERGIFCESTSNWRSVMSFNRVDYEKSRFGAAVTNQTDSSVKLFQWFLLGSVSESLIWSFGLMGACFLAAYQAVFEKKPFVCLVVLVGYWFHLSGPIQAYAMEARSFAYRAMGAVDLALLLKRRPTVCNKYGAKPLLADQGVIEFQNVDFNANDGARSLNNISFSTGFGRTVALVGGPGGDKSSVLNLALRLHDPDHGTITIDGQDIRNVTLESLHANIGVVPRDVPVFSGTIMDNIRYANASFTEEQVYHACRSAGLHDRFLSLPDAYATYVGDGGLMLTAGDLLLIAIARVMLKNPKIILLDETTDIMGSSTETLAQASLTKLCAGRTTISIARRLSTIVNADEVLVVDGGNLVGQGSHSSLLATNDYYPHLLACQHSVAAGMNAYTERGCQENRVQQKGLAAVGGFQKPAETHSAAQAGKGDRVQPEHPAVARSLQKLGENRSVKQTRAGDRAQQKDTAVAGGLHKLRETRSTKKKDAGDRAEQRDTAAERLQKLKDTRSTKQIDEGGQTLRRGSADIGGLQKVKETRSTVQIDEGAQVQQRKLAEFGDLQEPAEIHSTSPTDGKDRAQQTNGLANAESSKRDAEGTKVPAALEVGRPREASSETVVVPKGRDLRDDPHGEKIRKDSSGDTDINATRTSFWKPDAPEFVPTLQWATQRSIFNQGASKDGTDKENLWGMASGLLESNEALRAAIYGHVQQKHDSSETNESPQLDTAFEPATNGVVLMSPKKPRKKKGSKKKHTLRRHHTKSEPAGMGLTPFE